MRHQWVEWSVRSVGGGGLCIRQSLLQNVAMPWPIRAGHKNGQRTKQTELRIKHMEYIYTYIYISGKPIPLLGFCIILEAWQAEHKTAWLKEKFERVCVCIFFWHKHFYDLLGRGTDFVERWKCIWNCHKFVLIWGTARRFYASNHPTLLHCVLLASHVAVARFVWLCF